VCVYVCGCVCPCETMLLTVDIHRKARQPKWREQRGGGLTDRADGKMKNVGAGGLEWGGWGATYQPIHAVTTRDNLCLARMLDTQSTPPRETATRLPIATQPQHEQLLGENVVEKHVSQHTHTHTLHWNRPNGSSTSRLFLTSSPKETVKNRGADQAQPPTHQDCRGKVTTSAIGKRS
jgi:hypothetical protein